MQIRIGAGHHGGLICISIQLITHIKVVETRLQYEWFGIFQDFGSRVRGIPEQLVNLAPGGVVSDRDTGVEDQALRVRRRTEVENVAVQDHRIGNRDVHVLDRAYSRHH